MTEHLSNNVGHNNQRSHGNFHKETEFEPKHHSNANRSHSRQSKTQAKQPAYYSTQSESPDGSASLRSSDEGIEVRNPNFHPKADRSKNKRGYYYNRMPPSHSNVPGDPEDMNGPPIQVAPYYYYTDNDLSFVSGEKEPKRVVTTVDRPGGHNAKNTIANRVATSPLKSCIQNAEVKIARGGVAVSFDPWKSDS